MEQAQITTVAAKIFELAFVLKVENIKELPGVWERRIDDNWQVAVNGHNEPIDIPSEPNRMGCTIEAYNIAVWFNGFLAGLMSPFEGIIAGGSAANEETFIAALDKAIAEVK